MFLDKKQWSPYLIGVGLGVLFCCSYYYMGHLPGTTMSLIRVIDRIEYILIPDHEKHSLLFQTLFTNLDYVRWQLALVIGIFFGSLVASLLSGKRKPIHIPVLWKQRFGPSRFKRYFAAFCGGILALFGARIAGGGITGFGIAYGLQLSLAAWIFLITFFITGFVCSRILYKGLK